MAQRESTAVREMAQKSVVRGYTTQTNSFGPIQGCFDAVDQEQRCRSGWKRACVQQIKGRRHKMVIKGSSN